MPTKLKELCSEEEWTKINSRRDHSAEYARRAKGLNSSSPEKAKEEIAEWSENDPKYAEIVEGIIDIIRARANKSNHHHLV